MPYVRRTISRRIPRRAYSRARVYRRPTRPRVPLRNRSRFIARRR